MVVPLVSCPQQNPHENCCCVQETQLGHLGKVWGCPFSHSDLVSFSYFSSLGIKTFCLDEIFVLITVCHSVRHKLRPDSNDRTLTAQLIWSGEAVGRQRARREEGWGLFPASPGGVERVLHRFSQLLFLTDLENRQWFCKSDQILLLSIQLEENKFLSLSCESTYLALWGAFVTEFSS